MKINQRIAIFASIVLSSCTGQNVPVIPTGTGNATAVVTSTAATTESFPLLTDTPTPTGSTPTHTPVSSQAATLTAISTAGIVLATPSISDVDLIIPDTGQSQASDNSQPDKFQNFTIPVSGENAFFLVPTTGFPKGVQSVVRPQPDDLKYSDTDVILEIPSLGVKLPIVGVPKKDGTWDVSWLTDQAGWLEGSAFPSWSGNSVLTGHFYMASGLPGPFINLNTMKYGDEIIIHGYGQKNIFKVQTNAVVEPTDRSIMKHEESAWLTLITCADYDEETTVYRKRVVVRAVLAMVAPE
jgi:LPXTG-site transpeptidase (sortase) family protein